MAVSILGARSSLPAARPAGQELALVPASFMAAGDIAWEWSSPACRTLEPLKKTRGT